MLSEQNAIATIAVKDLGRARKFYEDVLGLKRDGDEQPGVQNYRSGSSRLLVYESTVAGTNKATSATWELGDVEREVDALRSKGVVFEHYDMPGMTLKGDVHVMGDFKAAWFKDSDGNILALVGR